MFVCEFRLLERILGMEKCSKKNNCLESADICNLAITCYFNYIINRF